MGGLLWCEIKILYVAGPEDEEFESVVDMICSS
jgi:hypothetical protein